MPELVDYIGQHRNDDLAVLASLEKQSEHPLAEAILQKAKEEHMELQSVSSFSMIE